MIDIRSVFNAFPQLLNKCDLITGNPPYLPISTGTILPTDQQRYESRFETRDGIEEYCLIASKLLSKNGETVYFLGSGKKNLSIELQ